MNTDILELLRERAGRVFSVKEVGKEIDRDRYERDQTWAASDLKGLCAKGFIEAINGCYWVPEEEDKNAARREEEKIIAEEERLAALMAEESEKQQNDSAGDVSP